MPGSPRWASLGWVLGLVLLVNLLCSLASAERPAPARMCYIAAMATEYTLNCINEDVLNGSLSQQWTGEITGTVTLGPVPPCPSPPFVTPVFPLLLLFK